jgi:2,4-dienoyl-CoA reductase (NADPH2)
MEQWWIRASAKGITQRSSALVTGLIPGGVSLQNVLTGEASEAFYDAVVLAIPSDAADGLFHELVASGVEAHRVGDALAPRRAHSAVLDGEHVGSAL